MSSSDVNASDRSASDMGSSDLSASDRSASDLSSSDTPDAHDMPFLDHLEALRWHIIRALGALLLLSVLAFVAKSLIFHTILLAPARADFVTYRFLCLLGEKVHIRAFCLETLPFLIQSRRMTGQFTMHIAASFSAGFVLAFPYVFWELWRFVRPGLHLRERAVVHGTTFVVSVFFFVGLVLVILCWRLCRSIFYRTTT